MKVLLCSIGRKENKYIREFVEWYKNLGFANIVLYDNNYDGEDDFHDVIGDYIDSGFVILKDYRNRTTCQLQAYNECYKEYGDKYDWIAFFDCDEFLKLVNKKDINEYLSSIIFKKFNAILVNWMCYGDGNMVESDGRPLNERITSPIPLDAKVGYDWPENFHVKSIVRGGLGDVTFPYHPHTTTVDKTCNDRGVICGNVTSPFQPMDFSMAYLKHYSTKTITEYCDNMIKGFPDREWDINKEGKFLIETRFFRYNIVTPEKIEIVKKILGIDMTYLLKTGKRKDVQLFMLCYDKEEYDFVDNAVMTPLQCGAANGKDVCKLKDNTGENISAANFLYVENTGTFWIWKNVKDALYKGQTQYRRRLEGIDENTDYEGIFKDHDVICAKPYNYPANHTAFIPSDTVKGGYAYSHCVDDLEILEKIVKRDHPEYSETWDNVINEGQDLYYSNGFVMRAEDYDRYCGFLFGLLEAWLKEVKITRYEDIIVHVARNLGAGKYPRYPIEHQDPMELTWPSIQWQIHIFGFLSERIFTLWLNHNVPQERRYEVSYTKMENGMYI